MHSSKARNCFAVFLFKSCQLNLIPGDSWLTSKCLLGFSCCIKKILLNLFASIPPEQFCLLVAFCWSQDQLPNKINLALNNSPPAKYCYATWSSDVLFMIFGFLAFFDVLLFLTKNILFVLLPLKSMPAFPFRSPQAVSLLELWQRAIGSRENLVYRKYTISSFSQF